MTIEEYEKFCKAVYLAKVKYIFDVKREPKLHILLNEEYFMDINKLCSLISTIKSDISKIYDMPIITSKNIETGKFIIGEEINF